MSPFELSFTITQNLVQNKMKSIEVSGHVPN